jgi:DNA-binding response OmpR family regulator
LAKRILVVNDTQEILELFEDILTDEGYEVELRSFAIRELDEIRKVKPDLIVLDYLMNGEDSGWQTLQKLKMTEDLCDIPVVVCTAASNRVKEMEGHLKEMGVTVVLKPFNIDHLVNAVKTMLDHTSLTSKSDHIDGNLPPLTVGMILEC